MIVGDRIMTTTTATKTGIEVAHQELAGRLAEDLPLLQHGSGDVPPPRTNPATTRVLAHLTARYVSSLVDAALDSQRILCSDDGSSRNRMVGAAPGLGLPPPVFATAAASTRRGSPRRTSSSSTATAVPGGRDATKRRRRPNEECWDEPVVPKIRKASSSSLSNSDGNGNGRHPGRETDGGEDEDEELAAAVRWVGAAGGGGADALAESSRARASYVRAPHAVGPQSFVFPVCHDTYAYNRVREIQAAKRSIEPLLMVDPTLAALVRAEGRPLKKKKQKKKKAKNVGHKKRGRSDAASSSAAGAGDDNGDDDDDDDEDPDDDLVEEDESDSADDGPVWPGLASILPVHRRRRG